jgi:hypothetical protein
MLGYLKKYLDHKRVVENEVANKNKKEIIDKMEAYYVALQRGEVDFYPRYLAVQDFWNAKRSGRLDRLNRLKKTKY